MSASDTKAGAPLAPDDASGNPDVVFKKQVLKLGLDGSSLPRLVVVTENNLYICLPSGGITRTIAIERIERVTLCPREDVVNDEHDRNESTTNDAARGFGATAAMERTGGSSSNDVSPPPSPNGVKKDRAKSPSSFFASVFSRGGGGGGGDKKASGKKSASRRSRGYKEDVDETHPVSPKSGAPPVQRHGVATTTTSEDHHSNTGTLPSSAWAVIATLGVAFEAPLALQLLQLEDGVDFVAALRASPQMSNRAVFNMPDEDGPTNAAGEPLFSPPPRRVDPILPRVLERDDNDDADKGKREEGQLARETDGDIKAVEEVELSPSSPRSTNVASPPPMPVTDDAEAAEVVVPSLMRHNSDTANVQREANEEPETHMEETKSDVQPRSGESNGGGETVLHSHEEEAPAQLRPSSSPPSSSPSSKASSVHTAEPAKADGIGDDSLPRNPSEPVVVLTPLHDPEPSSHEPAAPSSPSQLLLPTQNTKEKEPVADAAATRVVAAPEGRTPSPLRAAPHREAPQPPLQPVASVSAAVVPDTGDDARRVLRMDDEDATAPAPSAKPRDETKVPTMWEMMRDKEAHAAEPDFFSSYVPSSSAAAAAAGAAPAVRTEASERRASNDRKFFFERESKMPPNPPELPVRPSFSSASYKTDTNVHAAIPTSNRPPPPAGLNTTQHAAAMTASPAAVATFQQRLPATAAAATAVVRTPVHMEALQAELAEQSETVARLRRSLEAQENLLLELADVKNEMRVLRAVLAERDAQCTEWQTAYTHAEEHIGALRREQEHLLATQETRLRRAHREELEAVQAAFEEYDTRMTDFVVQLQRDHREEAAQWQHERRTLHHQLEEVHHAQDAAERSRAVAEAAAWEARQRPRSPPSRVSPPNPAAYLDQSLGYPAEAPMEPAGSTAAYENARTRVQEKLDAYVAQRQPRRRQAPATTTTPPPPSSAASAPSPSPRPRGAAPTAASSAPRGSASSPPSQAGPITGPYPTPASPWPQPRVTFGTQSLFDNLSEEGESGAGRPRSTSRSAAAAQPPLHRHDPRGDSLIQTPPSSSLERPVEREVAKRNTAGYAPHRRTFV